MDTSPQVAVLVETSTSWGIDIIRGIRNYIARHDPWLIHFEPRGRYEELKIPRGWKGDGVIARVTSRRLAAQIARAGIPAVNVSWYDFGKENIAHCTNDELYVGQLAAEHFLERGFRSFAYCGAQHRPNFRDRLKTVYVDKLREAGYPCDVYRPTALEDATPPWQVQLREMSAWLSQLSKPCAILVWSDVRGRQVTEACQYAGIDVPGEIAVLGSEYDELSSAVSHPPLSSIDSHGIKVGYEAARLLSQMMRGAPCPADPVLIRPVGIITRQSTDTVAVDDPLISLVLRYIRAHAHKGITVAEVLAEVPVSRRVLEQRFRQLLNRSPAAEIRRVRMERAKRLLIETDLSIAQVATACGFMQTEVFTRTFGREADMPPSVFRRSAQRDQ